MGSQLDAPQSTAVARTTLDGTSVGSQITGRHHFGIHSADTDSNYSQKQSADGMHDATTEEGGWRFNQAGGGRGKKYT